MPLLNEAQLHLVGQSEAHVCSAEAADAVGTRMHRDAVAPLLDLREAARQAGFGLTVLSGFRSFERQLAIWNGKVTGRIPVLDSAGQPLDVASLSEPELAIAILRWSALPGASRHHWGTDVDVFDRWATPPGYEVELTPAEVDADGMFGPLHDWLDARIACGESYGFYRPYDADRGGVAPERWHLSYAPLAAGFSRQLTPALLRTALERADLLLKDTVLQMLPALFDRFVANTCPAIL
ncbi:MAG: hypothetical protein MNPFHGCM_02201 [Gemmatimonadaceae bacterium]|nr:hypothetical protein [Gemmatimonadaceae bacterium]